MWADNSQHFSVQRAVGFLHPATVIAMWHRQAGNTMMPCGGDKEDTGESHLDLRPRARWERGHLNRCQHAHVTQAEPPPTPLQPLLSVSSPQFIHCPGEVGMQGFKWMEMKFLQHCGVVVELGFIIDKYFFKKSTSAHLSFWIEIWICYNCWEIFCLLGF